MRANHRGMIIVETKTIRLTTKEAQILRDVCFARMKVLQAGDPGEAASLPMPTELSEGIRSSATKDSTVGTSRGIP